MTPRSNEATITSENTKPVANPQSVTVWEDWLSDPITLDRDSDVDSRAWRSQRQNSSDTAAPSTGALPTVTYQSALELQRRRQLHVHVCTRPRR